MGPCGKCRCRERGRCEALIYRGWWLIGAALSAYASSRLPDPSKLRPPGHPREDERGPPALGRSTERWWQLLLVGVLPAASESPVGDEILATDLGRQRAEGDLGGGLV